MSSLTRRDGEIETIHQGPGAFGFAAESTVRLPTLACFHCTAHVVIRPERTRERAFCKTCNAYICDICKAATVLPGYIHRNRYDLANLVVSGNWQLSGSLSNPIIIPR